MNEAARARVQPDLRLVVVLVVALLAGLLALLLLDPSNVDDSSKSGSEVPTGVPVTRSPDELRGLARAVGHPVYWAGPQPGFKQEVTVTPDGRIYLRYLPPEVPAGDVRLGYTFVGTYPQRNALATVRRALRRRGASPVRVGGGGLGVTSSRLPQIVYVAYPGSDYLVEVYDRSARRAREIVSSGQLMPVQ